MIASKTNNGKKATIREVAAAAGVSISTVSRSLQHPEKVSKKTRDTIQKISKELGYQLNQQASDFRRGRSNAIIILVSDLSHHFYAEFFKGVEELARAEGFVVIIGEANRGSLSESNYVAMMLSGKADGLIIYTDSDPYGLPQNPDQDTILSPMSMVACSKLQGIDLPAVKIDNYHSAQLAANHLLRLGHKRFGQICGPLQGIVFEERRNGFSQTISQAGCSDEIIVEMPEFSVEAGRNAIAQLMTKAQRPTAIFCHNDEMAIGAMHELKKMGLRIPDDISLVGCDDMNFAQVASPPLTTIRLPKRAWGRAACDLLIAGIRGTVNDKQKIILPTDLIVRESTGPCLS